MKEVEEEKEEEEGHKEEIHMHSNLEEWKIP